MDHPDRVPLSDLVRVFTRIGLLSFGGPASQIALMHRELVDREGWLTEREYLSALSFCMLLPGPEAMQLATWCGWKLRGTRGALIAGGLFVAPGALIVLALAMAYAAWGDLPLVRAMFVGVQAAVVVIVAEALLRLSRRALKGRFDQGVAALAFAALFLFNLPFPIIVLAAGLAGAMAAPAQPATAAPALADNAHRDSLRAALIWGGLWLVPLAVLMARGGFLADLAWFFSSLAVVTFGGAYAVLAWMTQAVVEDHGWLALPQMIDALGLAETTPGPLILVTEFVAYLAGHGRGGIGLGLAAALVAVWMTFVPCFLWVLTGAPYVARLTHAPRLAAALRAITAAVVGVIANLGLWFALHVLFAGVTRIGLGPLDMALPDPGSIRIAPLILIALAAVLIFRLHRPLWQVLAAMAALGALGTLAAPV
jgi:chromate transporter